MVPSYLNIICTIHVLRNQLNNEYIRSFNLNWVMFIISPSFKLTFSCKEQDGYKLQTPNCTYNVFIFQALFTKGFKIF